ncbi:TVP38/TMEM64 family protein [Claveliimonas bilis]|uniref:TVP38/TMEM64 family membrane protein n=1 Tax=Claveliimonas bilis TaxID=3028070 RepID=A0ABN6Z2B1_9FIRM|nr:VTT domain-containing protein [Claveliimonas bilis]BDZ77232.1 TVP38/TMEM64 family protein [Claveliimonas bilis]BDZ78845.1 TVP38/TMEM64 family protein [Claveliimonas bilis]
MQKKKNWIKIIIFVCIVTGILMLNHHYGWSSYLGDMSNLMFLKTMVEENIVAALALYIIITIVGCVVLALPGVTFAVIAGMLFGPIWGIFACLLATTVGAMLAFLVGKFFLKDAVKPMLEKNKLMKKLLFSDDRKSDIIILIITRMVPIFPYNLQNFAYGITDIGFWKYSILTFVFMFPGVSFFTIGAAGLTAGEDKWKYFLIAGVLAVAVTVAGLLIKKKFLGNEIDAE